MVESHSIKERAYIFHLKDEKEIGREERENMKRLKKGKRGRDRQRHRERRF